MGSIYSVVKEGFEGMSVTGMCLLVSCGKQPTKNGGSYFGGKLSTSEGQIDFKAWSSSSAFGFLDSNSEAVIGSVVSISGKVNEYNGSKSLIVSEINTLSEEYMRDAGIFVESFLSSKYDIDMYWNMLVSITNKHLSSEGISIFNKIMADYGDRFKNEFAAVHYHDACRGGLLAHTVKICQMAIILSMYHEISNKVDKDLLYLGCIFHDIGKILEYNNGSISEQGKAASHTVLGGYLLFKYADFISEKKGETFFNQLMSVIASHHGEFGEPPRTVVAYVIHKIDAMEATLCGLDEQIGSSTGESQVKYDGFTLS